MIGHFFWIIGNWPNGIVVGNLMASVIWASLFEWRLRVHHGKLHKRLDKLEKRDNEHNSG